MPFLVAQMVKNLPAMWETQVWSLGGEDPLEEGMTTHSGILAWRIPWTEEPGGLQSTGSQRVRHDQGTNIHIWSLCSRHWPLHPCLLMWLEILHFTQPSFTRLSFLPKGRDLVRRSHYPVRVPSLPETLSFPAVLWAVRQESGHHSIM